MKVMIKTAALWVLGALCLVGPMMAPASIMAMTVEEMMADPVLEARARDISQQVRCLVCQNQSIDDSDAELAQDLRREIRQQLTDGASNDAILENLRGTYGDYVLLNPPVSGGTYVLWGAPFVIMVAGVAVAIANRRRMMPSDGARNRNTRNGADKQPEQVERAEQVSEQVSSTASRAAMIALGCGVIGLSLALYLALGRPDLADQPLADRRAEITASQEAARSNTATQQAQLTAARDAVAANPQQVEAWLRLAIAASAVNDGDSEMAALKQALQLTNDDPSIKALLAEAMSRAANGQITVPARRLVAEVLMEAPDEPRALYMAGLAAYQDEDFTKAVQLWQRLQMLSVSDAPWMALLADNIADAAAKAGIDVAQDAQDGLATQPETGMAISQTSGSAGPSAADMAAAAEMDADDRLAMIEDMVAGLAQRLVDNPQDPDGWQRLARAYDVLGRPAQAAEALIGAADSVDSDADAQIAALEYIITIGIEARQIEAANRLLARLDRIMPDGLERLFFRGHFAKIEGDAAAARRFWQLLLDRLPKDTPFANELQAEIANL